MTTLTLFPTRPASRRRLRLDAAASHERYVTTPELLVLRTLR